MVNSSDSVSAVVAGKTFATPVEARDDHAPGSNSGDSFTHLDLFSGIGGFALAVKWCGGRTIGFCEKEPYAQKVLSKNFGAVLADAVPSKQRRNERQDQVKIHADIFKLDGRQYSGVTLITGGFPCQPFSHAGKRRGSADDRHLWPEMFRVITEARPRFVLGENVAGIISLELDNCLSDLESIGYTARPVVVPACAVDARHRRDRVWLLCADTRHNNGTEQERQHERAKIGSGSGANGLDSGQDVADSKHGRIQVGRRAETFVRKSHQSGRIFSDVQTSCKQQTEPSMANPNEPGLQGRNGSILPECSGEWTARTSSPFHPAIWPDEQEWFTQSGMGRVAHGVPKRVDRLKGLGNAIVPQVAFQIIKAMMSL